MTAMIKLRHQQPALWHRGLAEDMEGLWEPWMLLVDKLLEDEQLLDMVYEAQGERHPQSGVRGRMQTPPEVMPPGLPYFALQVANGWPEDGALQCPPDKQRCLVFEAPLSPEVLRAGRLD